MNNREFMFIITKEMEGKRADIALSFIMEEISRNGIQRLIKEGLVTVNGEVCSVKKRLLKEGDEVKVVIPEAEELLALPENIPLDIVYEDSDLLIVNKGKNMVVHPVIGNETGTLVNAALYHCKDLSSINNVIRPGIVHRIDKDTTGLLVIAKNDKAHSSLAKQLEEHTIKRIYSAIVYNNFSEEQGTINKPLGRDPKNRFKRAVTELNGRRAVTHYSVIERFGNFTYIKLQLETGRTHQIRVHLASVSHPILGDPLYGPSKTAFGAKTQMLHAGLLGFIHPTTEKYMEFESLPPLEFTNLLEKLRSLCALS